ncbi:MAG: RNA polymerase factor sigma-54 [Bacteroidetes bacterium]|nr:RNA polymerase factor sigma-54 [Bacteroidota bacterium]
MLKQGLQLKLSQKLSPQQIQLMKLIQLPLQEFEQRLKQELEENPALEGDEHQTESEVEDFDTEMDSDFDNESDTIEAEDINIDEYLSDDEIPDYRLSSNNYSADDEEKETPLSSGTSFYQYLLSQLHTYRLDEHAMQTAEFIIGSLEEDGFLRRNLQDLVDDLAFTQNVFVTEEVAENALKIVQQLEPAGVGARDLRECLLIQIRQKQETKTTVLAKKIIEHAFESLSKRHYDQMLHKFDIDEQTLREALEEIEKLNPKPGNAFAGNNKPTAHVVPDFMIRIVDGELVLTLNGRNAPELHVSRDYSDMLKGYKEAKEKSSQQKEAVQFIKQKLDAAKWFIDAIKQRQQTLFVTMQAIMQFQKEYFLTGDERQLKPMILKDIADEIGMDVSTISRVANSKYVDTPYGTKLIKELFSESMKNDQGEDVSTLEIKKILETVIEKEDKKKPMTDDKLTKILLEKGYPIARRTVAKYREQLDIPVARLRKKL